MKRVEVVMRSCRNSLPLSLQSCNSWMVLKENWNRNKNSRQPNPYWIKTYVLCKRDFLSLFFPGLRFYWKWRHCSCFPVNSAKFFRILFPQETSGWQLLKFLLLSNISKNFFEYLHIYEKNSTVSVIQPKRTNWKLRF